MKVLHAVYAPPRCPASDEGSGRCVGRATTEIQVADRLGVGVYLKVCAYHADVIEEP